MLHVTFTRPFKNRYMHNSKIKNASHIIYYPNDLNSYFSYIILFIPYYMKSARCTCLHSWLWYKSMLAMIVCLWHLSWHFSTPSALFALFPSLLHINCFFSWPAGSAAACKYCVCNHISSGTLSNSFWLESHRNMSSMYNKLKLLLFLLLQFSRHNNSQLLSTYLTFV